MREFYKTNIFIRVLLLFTPTYISYDAESQFGTTKVIYYKKLFGVRYVLKEARLERIKKL